MNKNDLLKEEKRVVSFLKKGTPKNPSSAKKVKFDLQFTKK